MAVITQYQVNGHSFRVEKGIPALDVMQVKMVEMDKIPIDKLKVNESLWTDFPYTRQNVDLLKSRVAYIKQHNPLLADKKYSVRKDPENENKIRIFCFAEEMKRETARPEAMKELN